MPPKPRFTREEVISAAYELTKDEGGEAMVIRALAKRLKCTASPIFTLFTGIEEIREAVIERARDEFTAYLNACIEYKPAFKEFGMRWIRFAAMNPHLYRLIFGNSAVTVERSTDLMKRVKELASPIITEICQNFRLTESEASQLLDRMLIHGNGIAAFIVSGYGTMTEEEIGRNLSETCIGTAMVIHAKNGETMNISQERLQAAIQAMPVKIKNNMVPEDGE